MLATRSLEIRTANHAFCLRKQKVPEGLTEWKTFDPDVFKGHYYSHHSNKLKSTISLNKKSVTNPILNGISFTPWISTASLYQVAPLGKPTEVLLYGNVINENGDIIKEKPTEPVAWTTMYRGGKVFYTSLGNTDDFKTAPFNQLLVNAILWALNKNTPGNLIRKLDQ